MLLNIQCQLIHVTALQFQQFLHFSLITGGGWQKHGFDQLFCLHRIARFEIDGRLHAHADARRCTGGDHITRIKLRTPAQESEWRSILSARFAGPRPMWHRWVPVLLFVGKLRRLFYIAKGQPERAGVTKI